MHRQQRSEPGYGGQFAPGLVYTLDEVAELLRCSKSTIKNYVRDGVIESVKIGGLRRVRGHDLQQYVEGLAATPIGRRA